ncbi:hypothetical protein SB861_24965 [Paraburkholderia sp. SIMBA_049]
MKNLIFRTVTSLYVIGSVLTSSACIAEPLDSALDCRGSPHAFVDDMMKGQKIDAKPMHVESNSVNAFKPVDGSDVTALGFKVYAVLGYQGDDPLFEKGRSQQATKPLYGVVVSASTDAVDAKLASAGIHPTVRQVVPMMLTAIVCEPQ